MEKQINIGDQNTQQIGQNQVDRLIPVREKPKSNYFVIGSIVLICFVVFGFGGYYLGIQRNKNSQNNQPPVSSPTPSLTTRIPPITTSTNTPEVTQNPIVTTKPISIPSNWKKYTAEDPNFGIKTTMAMPSGYSFRFTGSEFTIQNDSDATELWDYSSSVYRDNGGVLKNHYDGSSRRAWYEKRLSERQSTEKIISVKEKPLNATTYLEITVQTPSYDDHGVTSGTKNGLHYVYAQNNILHMIVPASNKAYTSSALIPGNIESILASLTSIQTK
ncbi:hypothetical protein FJZ40_01795 [Candidatus Shapirobacteria bacterium]|nr:hypothetical protein [Candidatus Shapirobacteria bacterium]